jgi:hypothetical protein
MTVALSPIFQPDATVSDANGAPRSGSKLFTYLAGTSTKATTYKESTGSTAHTNPILLDANGLPPAPIWLTTGSNYKFVLAPPTDSDPPVSALQTIDNVTGINDVTAPAASTEWVASGMGPTYISTTSFSVGGDQTTALHVGRRLKITVTAGTYYGTIISSVYSSPNTTVKVLLDSGALDSGISAFSYGIAAADNTSLPFVSNDQQCGRLVYVSATQIRLDPQDGNTIWVFIGSAWKRRTIPSAGITAANTSIYVNGTSGQNLAASTAYFVYLFDNAGALTMDFSTTAPAVDAPSGLKIKTGVATRLLVGMVRTNASSQFATPGLVLSWYKRRAIQVPGAQFTAAATTGSTTAVELEVAAEAKFCSWAEEAVQVEFMGSASNSTGTQSHTTLLVIDGATVAGGGTAIGFAMAVYTSANNQRDNVSCGGLVTVTDGYHFVTVNGYVSANTGTWHGGQLFIMTRG